MRRVIEEISDDDDEWDNFKPSRILKKPKPSTPPSIESFAYRPNPSKPAASSAAASSVVNLSDDDDGGGDWNLNDAGDRDWNLDDAGDDDWNISDEEETAPEAANDLEDDVDEQQRSLPPRRTRGRRIVIEEDSDFENDAFGIEEDDDEEEEFGIEEGRGNGGGEEMDVVGKALRKCAKISAELRKELYGSSSVTAERYAEVEASSARIVTQEDVNAACMSEDSEFEPLLKPYQLVGVNFLLLLYRKNIGGGKFFI